MSANKQSEYKSALMRFFCAKNLCVYVSFLQNLTKLTLHNIAQFFETL